MHKSTRKMKDGDKNDVVLVTGGNGFVGSRIVRELLSHGYTVHATVRDKKTKKKFVKDILKGLPSDAGDRLKLVECNLKDENGWDEAVSRCDYVIHSAAVFDMKATEKEMVETAMIGTGNVLNACVKHRKRLKKIVYTSSVAAILAGHKKKDIRKVGTFDETKNSEEQNTHGYELSKLKSEMLAWDIIKKANAKKGKPAIKFDVICPALIVGPILLENHATSQSSDFIKMYLENKLLFGVDLRNPLVDVRDVAKVHRLSMEHEGSDNRFICAADDHCQSSFKNIAYMLNGAFRGKCTYRPPTTFLPNFVSKLMAPFHTELKPNRYWIGNPIKCSNNNVRDVLGMTSWIPIEASIKEHVVSMMKIGKLDPRGYDQKIIDQYNPYSSYP